MRGLDPRIHVGRLAAGQSHVNSPPSFPPTGLAESEPEDKLQRESISQLSRCGSMDPRFRGNDDKGGKDAKADSAQRMRLLSHALRNRVDGRVKPGHDGF